MGTASFAWFTLSANPEVGGMKVTLGGDESLLFSDKSDGDFVSVMDLTKVLQGTELTPVSTSDGLNWYVSDYNRYSGNIAYGDEDYKGTTPFIKITDNEGFYVYADIFVKTNANAEMNVKLVTPTNLENGFVEETASSSYVLSYDLAELKSATTKMVKILDKGPETCARAGMLIGKPYAAGSEEFTSEHYFSKENTEFWIYEPNADYRSQLDKQSDKYKTDVYIAGLKLKENSIDYDQTDGSYIQTYPIAADGSGPKVFPAANLIVQTKASWTEAAKEQSLKVSNVAELLTNKYVNWGKFVKAEKVTDVLYKDSVNTYSTTALNTAEDLFTTSKPIFTITKDEVIKIRFFFWIEGQDVDCWNDVAGMNFLARLEFATSEKN